ncbi:hypothetical protein GPJ56_003247 [Histomonas meleagridis]|uniref:uncharacterized protein n=1 Tax=Histomonas meleagridis TaxID=135588 RepID=UPI0035594A0F|nr:hypothetical protein GPJ56_003247 [Histomonas meleagridis]KAH0802413.1 hypothetical protein GO595_004791 [Histomonas meleagridis]
MAFDASLLPYIEDDEWRVLTAIEMGQRNHELVAAELVHSISGLRGSIHHALGSLVQRRLALHEGKPYDGYQLSKNGYDFLALHALVKRGVISHLGGILGQGKEADVYVGYTDDETPVVIKFHRIGRVSFRKAKDTRDYLNKKHSSSWLYLSRLSAQREFQNMTALQAFPVPTPIDWNRHCVVMSYINGTLLNSVEYLEDPAHTFEECVDLAVNLLKSGVVHADFSQFNIILQPDGKIRLIDFPQCLPYTSSEAEEKFNHDLGELRRFFLLRFDLEVESIPQFSDFVDEITPIDLKGKYYNKKGKTSEEEEEVDEDERIQNRVSKENRYKRKIKKRQESKTKSRLIREARDFQ